MRGLFVAALLLSGCFSPTYKSNNLRCEPTTRNCPDGYHCATNNRCWKDGTNPTVDMAGGPTATVDMMHASSPPDLTLTGKANGLLCSSAGDCASTHCVDGVCCDKACSGQCEACDGNTPGTCSAVQGPPHGSRMPCTGAGSSCAGTCDGTGVALCAFPSSTQICGAACNSHCDGNGACPGGAGSCPGGFSCGSGNCKTSCANDADCQTNFKCMAPSCVRIAESDCLDGLDNNGDGRIDCDDPTCTNVSCVPTPGNGNELGLMNQSTCTATGFTTAEPQNQGLSAPSCTGCSCSSKILCSETVQLFTKNGVNDLNCTSTNYEAYATYSQGFDNAGWCTQLNGGPYYAYKVSNQTYVTSSCAPTGTAALADSTWTSSTKFCAAPRTSNNNCGGDKSKVCSPKAPAATNLCVRIPGSTSGCPSGYAGSSGTYYASYQKGTCGMCAGCSYVSSSCGNAAVVVFWDKGDTKCQTSGFASTPDPVTAGTCYTGTIAGALPSQFSGFTYGTDPPENDSIVCSSPMVTTNLSTAQGPSVICCQ